MIGRSRPVFLAAAALLATSLGGCSQPNPASVGLNTEEAVPLSGVKVELPPTPSFADMEQPTQHPDGTLTVFGVRKQKDKYLGKEVKVKAYLVDIYQCPPCPKGQTCKLCEQPHFFLGDKADTKREKAMMVVDYLMPKQKPPFLTVGKLYEIEGGFSRNSPTGFAASDGLLVFSRMLDDKGVEFLSPAAALEAKALAGEAAAAAEMEKVMKLKAKNLK